MKILCGAVIIAGLILLLGCQQAGVKDVVVGEGAEFAPSTKQVANNPWPYVVIALGLALAFLSYLYFKQRKKLKSI